MDAGAMPKGLCKAGGVSLLAVTATTILTTVVSAAAPSPANTPEKALSTFPSQANLFLAGSILTALLLIFAIVGAVAIYAALKESNWGFALTGTVVGLIALAVTFTGNALSFASPGLSDSYASAAATAADRAAYVAAAWAISAAGGALLSLGGVLIAIWILVISWVMLKSVFGRNTAYLGFASGIIGLASSPPFVPFYVFLIFIILFAVWTAAVGLRLYKLGTASIPQSR